MSAAPTAMVRAELRRVASAPWVGPAAILAGTLVALASASTALGASPATPLRWDDVLGPARTVQPLVAVLGAWVAGRDAQTGLLRMLVVASSRPRVWAAKLLAAAAAGAAVWIGALTVSVVVSSAIVVVSGGLSSWPVSTLASTVVGVASSALLGCLGGAVLMAFAEAGGGVGAMAVWVLAVEPALTALLPGPGALLPGVAARVVAGAEVGHGPRPATSGLALVLLTFAAALIARRRLARRVL